MKIQVRVSGQASLHDDDSFADQQWADSSVTSRINYCASQPPGTPLDRPSSGLPDFLLKKVPALLQTEMGRKHFMAIAVKIYAIDWLILKITGNRRARFEWDGDKMNATWLVP
jgi:3-hydroxyisobutyrate dehydrogenase